METIQKAFKYHPLRDYYQDDQEQTAFIKHYASAAIKIPKEDWTRFKNTEPTWTKDKKRAEPPEPQLENVELRLYTDGSCPDNKSANAKTCPAGWGFAIRKHLKNEETPNTELITGLFGPVITKHHDKRFLGAESGSNNTGELTAICEGLKWLLEQEDTNSPAAIYYDSKYAAKIPTGEYNAETNKYLAAKARTLLRQVWEKRKISLEHIKGHSNDPGNDAADELANKGAVGRECRNQEQWDQIKETRPEIPEEKAPIKEKQTIRATTTHKEDTIRIPLPSYSYGAARRARFAFGRITPALARANTMTQRKAEEKTQEKQRAENQPAELEEEDFFLDQDSPSKDDCA